MPLSKRFTKLPTEFSTELPTEFLTEFPVAGLLLWFLREKRELPWRTLPPDSKSQSHKPKQSNAKPLSAKPPNSNKSKSKKSKSTKSKSTPHVVAGSSQKYIEKLRKQPEQSEQFKQSSGHAGKHTGEYTKKHTKTHIKRDPYAVWILETMLQQTQINTVLPYYERWMKRYPDVESVAQTTEEEALVYFQGLGYYRRLKSLLNGARELVESFGGVFPSQWSTLLKISGIGPYTAGALLSFAFHKRVAVVDGNIVRVLSRYYGLKGDKNSLARYGSPVWNAMETLLPKTGAKCASFNEAMMELGSVVCKTRHPRCLAHTEQSLNLFTTRNNNTNNKNIDKKTKITIKDNIANESKQMELPCPLMKHCTAYNSGEVLNYPMLSRKQKIERVYSSVFIIERGGHYLLFKRGQEKRLSGMWEFPTLEHHNPHDELTKRGYQSLFLKELGLKITIIDAAITALTAQYTRYRADVRVFHAKWVDDSFAEDAFSDAFSDVLSKQKPRDSRKKLPIKTSAKKDIARKRAEKTIEKASEMPLTKPPPIRRLKKSLKKPLPSKKLSNPLESTKPLKATGEPLEPLREHKWISLPKLHNIGLSSLHARVRAQLG